MMTCYLPYPFSSSALTRLVSASSSDDKSLPASPLSPLSPLSPFSGNVLSASKLSLFY
ncbi:MAG TPA: hypothetical protein ACHBZ9_08180 [Arsenophonus nasoniae]|uniref:hypothetical protein n=1 Tax=Arsenophonus nasoniae TaxID=638 RepID=UPI003879850A